MDQLLKTKLKEEINILIPDGEMKFALYVGKCLSGFKNIKIHLLSKVKWVDTRFSNNFDSFNYYANIKNEKDWIAIIKKEIVEKNIDVLFPVNEGEIRLLTKYKDEFKSLLHRLILPDTKYFDIANNKWNLFDFLEYHDINRPRTFHIEIDVDKILTQKLPVIFKPVGKKGGEGIKIIDNNKSLVSTLDEGGEAIIQKIINGYDIGMSVLCENGKILAFTIQKEYLEGWTPFNPSLGVEFLYRDEVFDMVEVLMSELNWSGLAHIDIRYDESDNKFKIIEINPRIWGSIQSSEKVGVNFPYLYCLSSLGLTYKTPEYNFEKCVNSGGIYKTLKSYLQKDNRLPFPENTLIKCEVLDPFPIIWKLFFYGIRSAFPNNKFLQKFRSNII